MAAESMTDAPRVSPAGTLVRLVLAVGAISVMGVVAWATLVGGGDPDPLAPGTGHLAGVLDIGVLVFREGLECILVLAAVTATMRGPTSAHRKPVAMGAAVAFGASLVTWLVAVRIVDELTQALPALYVQALTGLLAILVLLVVMNWFFHKVYWTGWIRLHTDRKKRLMRDATRASPSGRLLFGLALLGFTSLYREGFEIVLFLQSYRLRLGGGPVLHGVSIGLALTAMVALLTFVANRSLPYKKMLVFTGVMLGAVLLVMVGEQAQEMQLAGWLSTTPIPELRGLPGWVGLWFAVFPTVETLSAQALAALLVLGSFFASRMRTERAMKAAPASRPSGRHEGAVQARSLDRGGATAAASS